MKKTVWTLILLLSMTSLSFAAEKKTSADDAEKLAEIRKHIEEKRADLNGSSWEVTLSGSSNPKMNGTKDTFIFQDGQFKSKAYEKRGFPATNYTVSAPSGPEGMNVWETMQTAKEGLVFLRGEWSKDKMHGTVTEQLDGGKKMVEYSFSTDSRKVIPPNASDDTDPATGSTDQAPENSGKALVSKPKK